MLIEASIPDRYAGQRLDRVLAQLFPEYSRSRLMQWIESGAVTLNHEIVTVKQAKKGVMGGEHVTVHTQPLPETLAFQPEPMSLNIVFEDPTLLVIDKPSGLVVHPGHGHWSGTLLNGLLHHCPELHTVPRAGIVHRLDKDTSGLMVVAKTLAAQTDLVRQLQARSIKREYQALAWGTPFFPNQEHRIENWMGRHSQQRTKMCVLPEGMGKRALSFFRVHRSNLHYSWIFCRLGTGRTHQLRVHLSHLGHPILGDTVYGRRHDDFHSKWGQHALHAFRLTLQHPGTLQTLSWKSALPAPLESFITSQGWHDSFSDEHHYEEWDEEDEGWEEEEDDLDEE